MGAKVTSTCQSSLHPDNHSAPGMFILWQAEREREREGEREREREREGERESEREGEREREREREGEREREREGERERGREGERERERRGQLRRSHKCGVCLLMTLKGRESFLASWLPPNSLHVS